MKTPKNESILSGLLAKNPVWNEISGGDNDSLANSIESGEWIGLMTGPDEDGDAAWDKYIADTFGPFADFVEGRYIKPDENEPDFRVAQIKFKPLFNRLSTNAKTGLLADLGDVLKDGYFVESKKREGANRPMAADGRVHQFVFDFVITEDISLADAEKRIREALGNVDEIELVSEGNSETSWSDTEYYGEGKKSEAGLSAKMQARAKVRQFTDLFNKYHGFQMWGPGFLDLYNGGKFGEPAAVPGDAAMTKEKAQELANKRFGDFDDYVEYTVELIPEGGPKGEDMWFPCVTFKPSIMDLSLEDAKFVFSELAEAIDKAMGY